ncbi:hypothetical protein [Streptobacillus moniliformis]|nr:hypothetical protein [Streptobacillus moniliformis]
MSVNPIPNKKWSLSLDFLGQNKDLNIGMVELMLIYHFYLII